MGCTPADKTGNQENKSRSSGYAFTPRDFETGAHVETWSYRIRRLTTSPKNNHYTTLQEGGQTDLN